MRNYINRQVILPGSTIFLSILVVGFAFAQERVLHSDVLLRSSEAWNGSPYLAYPDGAPELSVLKITIPPNSQLPWHTHPIPNAAYVLSGTLTVEDKTTGQQKIITQGQVLSEMVGQLHRGITGGEEAVLIVFYAGAKDIPLSQR